MKIKLAFFAFIGLAIIVLSMISYFDNQNDLGSNAITSSNTFITTNASDMLPLLDSPESSKIDEVNEMHAKRSSTFYLGYTVMELTYEVSKFSSISEAVENYNSAKKDYSEYKQIKVNLGSEGFGIENVNSQSIVVFRKANVVVKVQLDGQHSTLEQAVSDAKKVRI